MRPSASLGGARSRRFADQSLRWPPSPTAESPPQDVVHHLRGVPLKVRENVAVGVRRQAHVAWPSRSETTFGCTPARSTSLAAVWHRSWSRRRWRLAGRLARAGTSRRALTHRGLLDRLRPAPIMVPWAIEAVRSFGVYDTLSSPWWRSSCRSRELFRRAHSRTATLASSVEPRRRAPMFDPLYADLPPRH